MRSRLISLASAAITSLLGACFSPDTSALIILCSADNPACPDGQMCVDSRCVRADADLGGDAGTADQASSIGCADGSRTVVGVAYACAGGFKMNKARSLCAPGWKVCTKAAGIDLAACDMLNGFFFADAPAYYQGNPGNEACGTGGMNPLWYGCGSRMMGVRMSRGCQGFTNLIECSAMMVKCMGANPTLDTTMDDAPADGVLCCQ